MRTAAAKHPAFSCDCESGQPVWARKPSQRHFAIKDIDGNVERMEACCDTQRLVALIDKQLAWSIPVDWSDCEVFGFGDDGTALAFVELPAAKEETTPGEDAVARNYGLD